MHKEGQKPGSTDQARDSAISCRPPVRRRANCAERKQWSEDGYHVVLAGRLSFDLHRRRNPFSAVVHRRNSLLAGPRRRPIRDAQPEGCADASATFCESTLERRPAEVSMTLNHLQKHLFEKCGSRLTTLTWRVHWVSRPIPHERVSISMCTAVQLW
jgi:hypothetical protein